MKKVLSIILALAMILCLCACGSKTETSVPEPVKEVEAPVEVAADFEYPETDLTITVQVADPATTSELNIEGRAVAMLCDLVSERSNGKVTIEPFYSNVLGSNPATVVVDGEADMALYNIGSAVCPLSSVFQLPRLITSLDMAWELFQPGEPMFELLNDVAEDSGVTILSGFSGCIRHIYNSANKEVHVPADLAGMNIRVYADASVNEFFQRLSTPVTLSMSEVYTSLQTGTIDGLEFNCTAFINRSLQEVSTNFSDVAWQWLSNPMIYMSLETYDKLPAEVRALIKDCCQESMEFAYNEFKRLDETAMSQMEDAGMTVTHLTDAEYAEWDAVSAEMYDTICAAIGDGAVELKDEILKILADY